MKKKLLVPSLEELNNEIVGDVEPLSEDQIEEMKAKMDEIEEEAKLFFDDDADNDARIEDGEAAVERLENIAEVIGKYGISGPMMMLADPYRELIGAGAISTDYENMSDIPVVGDDSLAAVESINGVIDSVSAKLYPAIEAIGYNLKGYILWGHYWPLVRFFTTQFSKNIDANLYSLKQLQKHLTGVKYIDKKVFASKTVKVLSKDDFSSGVKLSTDIVDIVSTGTVKLIEEIDNVIAAGSASSDKIKAIASKYSSSISRLENPNLTKILGIKIESSEDDVKISKASGEKLDSNGTLGDKGWGADDAKPAVLEAIRISEKFKILTKDAAKLQTVFARIEKSLKTNYENKSDSRSTIKLLKNIMDNYKTISKLAVKNLFRINRTAIRLGEIGSKSKL